VALPACAVDTADESTATVQQAATDGDNAGYSCSGACPSYYLDKVSPEYAAPGCCCLKQDGRVGTLMSIPRPTGWLGCIAIE
jgi:hypothetical protein